MGIYIMQSRTILACWGNLLRMNSTTSSIWTIISICREDKKKMAASFDTAIKIDGVFTPRTIPHRTSMGTSFKAKDAVLRV